jgi:WD40 repeat protein
MANLENLELETAIGFEGKVPNGLRTHPDRMHMVYAIGCNVVIENLQTRHQEFLIGHNNSISCIAVTKDGRYVASGQNTYMGFKADIIIWDFETKKLYARLVLHKVKVLDLAFSANDQYLFSLGGQDDGSVVVWNVATKEPICGSPAQHKSAGITHCLAASPVNDNIFFTAGNNTLRIWELDLPNRKIRPLDVNLGQTKRVTKSIVVGTDSFFCGTTTGDILEIAFSGVFKCIGPEKNKYSLGVTALQRLKTGDLLAGSGDGKIMLLDARTLKPKKTAQCDAEITSISLRGDGHMFFVGTAKSQIYRIQLADWKQDLLNTCHNSVINDIAFPFGSSELFATCSFEDIRVWHAETSQELLRIKVPNKTCSSILFSRDGQMIVSGWNDGKIRAFYPESGKIMFTINDAHQRGVTSLAMTSDCKRIISGGGEGQVRVWLIRGDSQELESTMKEHKNAVVQIKINKNDTECLSASWDGTCIVWNLKHYKRSQILFANTLFQCIAYHPEEFHIITGGSDRKIAYWESFDAAQIRELEASKSGTINGLDVDAYGELFVTASSDKLVKVWKYNEGEVLAVGVGHGSEVKRCKICPNNRRIISVGDDGSILRWRLPKA